MSVYSDFRDAFRLATWRRPLRPFATLTPVAILLIAIVLALFDLSVQWFTAGDGRYFEMYGLNALAAWIAASLAIIILFAGKDSTGATMRNLVLLWAAICSASFTLPLLMRFGEILAKGTAGDMAIKYVALGIQVLLLLSFALGARKVFQAAGTRRPGLRGVAFAVCWWLALEAVPNWPAFVGQDFSRATANVWEYASARRRADAAAQGDLARRRAERMAKEDRDAKIESLQPARLDAELARLAPRERRKANVFVVGVAGWSEQDVFLKETEQSLEILRRRLGVGGHTVALVNNDSQMESHPIATIQNLSQALRGVAAKMNLEEDVLLLTMTSHGSRNGFALEHNSLVDRTLSPRTLRAMLDEIGFRNRVVIISACYSGVFVPVLADARTMVISAASATHTSFGCSNDRDWTYFGEAFFDHGLREETTLTKAFEKAKGLIAKWEREQKLDPSDPQIFVGAELRKRFPALIGADQARQAQASP